MSEFKDISTKNLRKSIKRLTMLADYLRDNVKNKRFELSTFFNIPDVNDECGTEKELKGAVDQLKEGFCGTTACAVGHACLMPEFQKKGLKIRLLDGLYSSEKRIACTYKNKKGEIFEDFEAAEKFFKISNERAHKLFSTTGYNVGWREEVSKSKVVKAIRDYTYRANKHLKTRVIVSNEEIK